MTDERPGPRMSIWAGFLLLLVRGFLLCLVLPVGLILWLPVTILGGRPRIRLGQFLGWIDYSMIAAFQRTFFRAFTQHPLEWVPARRIREVKHRISLLDSA